MISLLPSYRETLVVGLPWEDVIAKISNVTTSLKLIQDGNEKFVFTGWVKEDRFRISLKIRRPNNFIPTVTGRIDPTSSGCLIYTEYRLFPVTRMYLTFWCLFTLITGIIVSRQYQNLIYIAIALALAGFIYWIVWANFKLQLRFTREALMKILS